MALIGTMLWLATPAQAAQQTGKPAKPAPSAPAPADPIQTQAVFVNPRNPQEGRDPFFPRSTLPYTRYNPQVTTNRAVSVSADLKLSGISGSSEHRLAIINNKTFEINEEGDVISGSDKVRIRCLEIKPESVIIQFVAGGLRREIHLRRGL
jgi:hypothetical protein